MKQKDKELLLKDLGARLPYGVKVTWDKRADYSITLNPSIYREIWKEEKDQNIPKVYLRPISSMTEEEAKEYRMFIDYSYNDFTSESIPCVYIDKINDYLDWLNAHHFDYRGLIEKGLALEALEGIYN